MIGEGEFLARRCGQAKAINTSIGTVINNLHAQVPGEMFSCKAGGGYFAGKPSLALVRYLSIDAKS